MFGYLTIAKHRFANPSTGGIVIGMTNSDDWSVNRTSAIGQRVKELRGSRSGRWLSDRTGELGLRVSRASISELEGGKRRSITTAEITVLAEALDVPLLDLLTAPVEGMGVVEYLPGLKLRPAAAWAHYAGLGLDRVRDALDLDMYTRLKARARLDQISGDDETTAAYLVLVDAKVRELRERLGLPDQGVEALDEGGEHGHD